MYVLKSAAQDVECVLPWQVGFLNSGETAREDLGWTVTPVTGAEDLAIRFQDIGDGASRAVLRGGVPGETYMVAARARTDRGRVIARTAVVQISKDAA